MASENADNGSECTFSISSAELPQDIDGYDCNRTKWEDSEYCIWHTNTDDKSLSALKKHRAESGERLDGAIINGIDFSDEISFSDCSLINAEAENTNFSGIHQRTDFRGTNLKKSDFSNSDLVKSNFGQANLEGAIFSNSVMVDVNLTGTNLDYADFSNANLRRSNLSQLDLSDAVMNNSILEQANLKHTDLSHCSLSNTDLSEANFTNAKLRYADFCNSNISDTDFSNANLEDAELSGANAKHSCFSEAILSRAECLETNFENSDFYDVEYTDGDATGSIFKDATANNSKFKRTTFNKADFKRADLIGTNLEEARLQETNLRSAKLDSGNLAFADLAQCDARDASFKKADLENSNLTQADLRGADLRNSLLYQIIITDSRINDKTNFGLECRYETDPNTEIRFEEDTHRLDAAAWTYRRLESLYSSNSLANQAYQYHIKKEEIKRKHYFESQEYVRYSVSTLNRWLTRHGEGLSNIITASFSVILIWTVLYPFFGGIQGEESTVHSLKLCLCLGSQVLDVFINSLYFSFATFSALGSSGYTPASLMTKYLASVQSLLGTLLIALFIFTLGRRVDR